jgi:predicted aldo/keto reductase-like oxidoreductase
MRINYTRRKFLKATLGAGAAIVVSPMVSPKDPLSAVLGKKDENKYDPKGLPTSVLGKTGVVIPRIAIGLGSRFLNIPTLDEAIEMASFALDNGMYYWDTAHDYVNQATGAVSEERLGHIIKDRRKEIFLSTKISARDTGMAKAQVEESLKRLQTDHVDMLKIHSVESPDDVKEICKEGGVLDLFSKLKEEGITRFIGFSGHGNAEALKAMAETGRFDSMLFAMNHYGENKENRQGRLIPAAKLHGMGVMLMKSVRPKETIKDIDIAELVRFALSLDGPDGIVVGMDSKKVVQSNLSLLRNFNPMTNEEKIKYAIVLSPYFRHENLEWMKEGYHDGYRG